MTKGWLEAFSDGVIAIIITVTIWVIDLPEGDDQIPGAHCAARPPLMGHGPVDHPRPAHEAGV